MLCEKTGRPVPCLQKSAREQQVLEKENAPAMNDSAMGYGVQCCPTGMSTEGGGINHITHATTLA